MVYTALQELVRNSIAYGPAIALEQDALITTLMSAQESDSKEHSFATMMKLHQHAYMADKSGRSSPPTIQKQMKETSFKKEENFLPEGFDIFEKDFDMKLMKEDAKKKRGSYLKARYNVHHT